MVQHDHDDHQRNEDRLAPGVEDQAESKQGRLAESGQQICQEKQRQEIEQKDDAAEDHRLTERLSRDNHASLFRTQKCPAKRKGSSNLKRLPTRPTNWSTASCAPSEKNP